MSSVTKAIERSSWKFGQQMCKCGHTREYHNSAGSCFGSKGGRFCPCVKFRIDRKNKVK